MQKCDIFAFSRQRSESPGERGARNAARSKRSRSRSRGRQLKEVYSCSSIAENSCHSLFDAQVMRLQKRKEEVRERLEAVRPKAEVKEEPLEDVSRSTVGKN